MMTSARPVVRVLPRFVLLLYLAPILLAGAASVAADDEALLFTPPGFTRPGQPRTASGPEAATLRITVVDRATGRPTPCRLNVVGPDGNFYQPAAEPPLALQPDRPVAQDRQGEPRGQGADPLLRPVLLHDRRGRGRRPRRDACASRSGRGSSTGPGRHDVEVGRRRDDAVDARARPRRRRWPRSATTRATRTSTSAARPRPTTASSSTCSRPRTSASARSSPTTSRPGPYNGVDGGHGLRPSSAAWAKASVRSRGDYLHRLGPGVSQRHLWASEPVPARRPGARGPERSTPTTGRSTASSAARPGEQGGFAIYAHGGYAQAIYADFVQKDVDAVELLQFGVYRGIELADWYRILNIGYRFPCVGASDYPACRKLGDCRDLRRMRRRRARTSPAGSGARPRGGASSRRARCSCSRSTASARAAIIRKDGRGPASRAGPGPRDLRGRADPDRAD